MFADEDGKNTAIATCGGSGEEQRNCLFDVALTGNQDVGGTLVAKQNEFDALVIAFGESLMG